MSLGDTTFDGAVGLRRGTGVVWSSGRGVMVAVVSRSMGLRGGRSVSADLSIEPIAGTVRERWTRQFGGRRWTTDCERTSTGIVEWVGPRGRRLVGLVLDVDAAAAGATLTLRSLRVGRRTIRARPVRLDVILEPRVGGGLSFDVACAVLGRPLVAYRGWIA